MVTRVGSHSLETALADEQLDQVRMAELTEKALPMLPFHRKLPVPDSRKPNPTAPERETTVRSVGQWSREDGGEHHSDRTLQHVNRDGQTPWSQCLEHIVGPAPAEKKAALIDALNPISRKLPAMAVHELVASVRKLRDDADSYPDWLAAATEQLARGEPPLTEVSLTAEQSYGSNQHDGPESADVRPDGTLPDGTPSITASVEGESTKVRLAKPWGHGRAAGAATMACCQVKVTTALATTLAAVMTGSVSVLPTSSARCIINYWSCQITRLKSGPRKWPCHFGT